MQPRLQHYVDTIRDLARAEPPYEVLATRLEAALETLLEQPFELRSEYRRLPERGHGRNLLYKDEETGFVVVAMIWPPGHVGMAHDHAATWCSMAVLEGDIRVQNYDRIDDGSDPDRCELRATEEILAGPGDTAVVQPPPHDYHLVANASPDQAAVTLHTYATDTTPVRLIDLETCAVTTCAQEYHNDLARL